MAGRGFRDGVGKGKGKAGSGNAGGNEASGDGYEIFIKGLPLDTDPDSLKMFFAAAGSIEGAPRLDLKKGLGWITFTDLAGLAEAVTWTGCCFEQSRIIVRAAKHYQSGTHRNNASYIPSVQAVGTHTPALCEQVVETMVSPNTGGTYIDGTFGRGGHTRAMLAALSPAGRLHAFDMDPEAIVVGKKLMKEDSRFTIHHAPFSSMREVLGPLGVKPSGVFMDLGISSPQFDDAHRGFRPEADGPLDLRFDQSKGVPASEFLKSVPREELIRIIAEYGETSDKLAASRVADAICLARSAGTLPGTTREFAALVAQAKGKEYQAMHPAKMTFQALRVHLNDEFGEMRKGMREAFKLLGEGGRIGILTWKHSECYIVMEVFRTLEAVRDKEPLLKWYREQKNAPALPDAGALEMDDVVRPSEKELRTNSRARSALLHVMRKRGKARLSQLEKLAYALPAWEKRAAPVGDVADAGDHDEAPKKKKRKKDRESVEDAVPSPLAWSIAQPLDGECAHCGDDHATKRCTFGSKAGETYLPCAGSAPAVPCFWRRFLVPLSRADAKEFDPADPRGSGRADVGVRCVSAAVFRSQGLRHNTRVCLSFEASGHTLEVAGALARGLVPDEGTMAQRLRQGLDTLFKKKCGPPNAAKDPEGWCASEFRGFSAEKRTTLNALKDSIEGVESRGRAGGRVVLLVLDASGLPVQEACRQIQTGPAVAGIVTVVGDHRGYSEVQMAAYCEVAQKAGAEVVKVSLGGQTLLASHAIVLLQHYFDELLHRCEVGKQIDYGRGSR